jgi:hypothetical protein
MVKTKRKRIWKANVGTDLQNILKREGNYWKNKRCRGKKV